MLISRVSGPKKDGGETMRKFRIPILTTLILLAAFAVLWSAGSTYTNTRVSKWGISDSNLTGVAVSGTSTIDDTIIGGTTPAAGSFTTLGTTGALTLGDGTATVAIDSSDWDISATGAMTGIGAITADGLITFTNATDASNLTTASAVLSGGMAVTKQLYLGDDLDMSVSGTGVYDITLKDSVADALSIVRGTTDMMVFNSSTPSITITPATDVVGDFTAGTVTSDAGVGGTIITASTGFALGDGDYVGVIDNERLLFNTAGTIVVDGADLHVGNTASDDVIPSLKIVGDADSDGSATTSETLEITLTANATPTSATWGFTSTQGAGYTFDKAVTFTGGIANTGTVTTTDINGGSIDGTTIGANASAAGTFNDLNVTQAVSTDVTAIATYSNLTVSGTWGTTAPSYGLSSYNKINGSDIAATDAYMAGVVGMYNITGTNATTYPACGVLGWIGDLTTTADGAFVALLDGDSGTTSAGAAYAVRYLTSTPGNAFSYGLDLYSAAIGGYNAVTYGTAEIRLSNGATVNAGSATTRAAVNAALGARTAGSLYLSSAGKIYLCVDNSGSDTSWEKVTTSVAD